MAATIKLSRRQGVTAAAGLLMFSWFPTQVTASETDAIEFDNYNFKVPYLAPSAAPTIEDLQQFTSVLATPLPSETVWQQMDVVHNFATNLIRNMKDLPQAYAQAINDNFADLL